jgi:hypothetical protein
MHHGPEREHASYMKENQLKRERELKIETSKRNIRHVIKNMFIIKNM